MSVLKLPSALLLISISALAAAGVPGSTSPVNVDRQGMAVQGYDVVAYFDTGEATHGSTKITATYEGAQYHFATAAHKQQFLKDPQKYLPQFGGFCAAGASFGEKVDIDPQTGKVVDGKLYLNNGAKAQSIFDADTPGTIKRAGEQWPTVKDKAL